MTLDETRRCTYEYETSPDSISPTESVAISRPKTRRCPYAAADANGDRCLFHHPDSEFPVGDITDQFCESLTDESQRPSFAGGQLSGLQLGGETLSTPDGRAIDLRGATISGDLDLTDATVEVPLLLDGAAVTGSLNMTGATFKSPVSLVDADIGRRMFLQRATVSGGIAANGLTGGYLDARGLTVDGTVDLTETSFSAIAILARSSVEEDLIIKDTSFDYRLDLTGINVGGTLNISGTSCKGDLDIVASSAGSISGAEIQIGGETDCRHTTIDNNLNFAGAFFEEEAKFDDINVECGQATFDGCRFEEKVSFSTAQFSGPEVRFKGSQFDDEAWFTYVTVSGNTIFDQATFHGHTHLRDGTFEGNLSLREARTTSQAYLHNSTVGGDFTAARARFDHFQFSAKVEGAADFENTRFDEKAIFRKSTFNGGVSFGEASFAGQPNFNKSRFTGETTFDRTEFLVEPTFEETRFAIDPDFEAAHYPTPASRNLDKARQSMILARPEALQHTGFKIEAAALTEDIVIPSKTSALLEDKIGMTRAVTSALTNLDSKEWYQLFDEGLRTARTAVTQLGDNNDTILVFGISVDRGADSAAAFIQEASTVGVYSRGESGVEFGHLNPHVEEFDYLIPVRGDDEAFEAGASVAVLKELAAAMVRFQTFRTALLERRDENEVNVNTTVLPVLVAAAKAGEHPVSEEL